MTSVETIPSKFSDAIFPLLSTTFGFTLFIASAPSLIAPTKSDAVFAQ
ncbi:hypothetical protein [uncultured Fusobacterium sp.]|nr:hypothetical protein [uncultured Fusobacterium sp.]